MKRRPKQIRTKLLDLVKEMSEHPDKYIRYPGKDFTRKRKLPFEKMIGTLLCLKGGSLTCELMDAFGCSANTATSSAFIQQRDKIRHEALADLFHSFVKAVPTDELYKGYRLLALDGSVIHIPTNAEDAESYIVKKDDSRPFNLMHLNTMYDLLSHIYTDAVVQKCHTKDESRAFCDMVDRTDGRPAIFIADRGYESFNNMAHVQEKGCFFLIRIKDNAGGIGCGLDLPDTDTFDKSFSLSLTRKQTNEMKETVKKRDDYRFLRSCKTFDYLPVKNRKGIPVPPYVLSFRIVRFQISDNNYETVITNLDTGSFPAAELKKLYHMRWGIETSFRELKYTLGLLHFHAKKTESVLQEIFASLIMYNFTELITSHVIFQKKNRKYVYKANFSVAVHVCRQFLLGNVSPSVLETLIAKNVSPVRPACSPGRNFPRNLKPRSAVSFLYRIA